MVPERNFNSTNEIPGWQFDSVLGKQMLRISCRCSMLFSGPTERLLWEAPLKHEILWVAEIR